MRDPCRDCKLWTAGYPDERGRPNRLCTMCAQKAGTHVIKRPCRGCSKTTAHIMDATGKPNQFCAECAEARGLDKTRKRTKKRRCPDKREVCSVATALLTMASECEM